MPKILSKTIEKRLQETRKHEDEMEESILAQILKEEGTNPKDLGWGILSMTQWSYKKIKQRMKIWVKGPDMDRLVEIFYKRYMYCTRKKKEAVKLFKCCFMYWFGPSPTVPVHVEYKGFRGQIDQRNRKKLITWTPPEEPDMEIIYKFAQCTHGYPAPSTRLPEEDNREERDNISREECMDEKVVLLG